MAGFVLGVQVRTPGWQETEIAPHPGGLLFAEGKVPTPKGPVAVTWRAAPLFTFSAVLPAGMKADVRLPTARDSRVVWKNGQATPAHREGDWWVLNDQVQGRVSLEER